MLIDEQDPRAAFIFALRKPIIINLLPAANAYAKNNHEVKQTPRLPERFNTCCSNAGAIERNVKLKRIGITLSDTQML